MFDATDSDLIRTGGYLVAAVLTMVALRRERRRAASVDGIWPPFWVLTCAVLVVMAIGRASGVGDVISALGREEFVDDGWYDSRRRIQAGVVAFVGLGWLLSVSLACWRVPERRRRYLPMGLAIVTLGAFVAIRIVSLHQIDSVLYRRHIAGVRVGTLTELGLVLMASAVTFWVPIGRSATPRSLVALDSIAVEP